jgi:flavin-dependent dehydrogenase
VDVHERRGVCGSRFGGDLQGLENWSDDVDVLDEFRGYGIAIDFDCDPVTHGYQTNGRRTDGLSFPRPGFYLVKRGKDPETLDQCLLAQAVDAGVRVHFRSTIEPAEADIVATGPGGRNTFAIDKGVVFSTDHPDICVALLNDAAGLKGYSYLLVTKGYGCLCTMLFDDFPSVHERFAEARRMLADRFGVAMRDERPVGGIGAFTLTPQYYVGKAPCVGEAAGLQDLLWGFGIRTAIRSGVLAAQCLLDGREYGREAAARFDPAHRAGVVSRAVWELARVGNYRLVMLAFRLASPYRLMRLSYSYKLPQRLLYPVARRYVRLAHGL